MRLVEVYPEEGLRPLLPREPGARGFHRPSSRALLHQERGAAFGVAEAVVVDVESAIEAEARVEREGTDEGARVVTRLLEERGQGVGAVRKAEARVVPDTVVQRIAAGKDVAWKAGARDVAAGARSPHPALLPEGRATMFLVRNAR